MLAGIDFGAEPHGGLCIGCRAELRERGWSLDVCSGRWWWSRDHGRAELLGLLPADEACEIAGMDGSWRLEVVA